MAQTPSSDLLITTLRGGMNDTDPASALPEDQCVLAQNVEFFFSTLGERRRGCVPLNIQSSGLEAATAITHLSQWYPDGSPQRPEKWVFGRIDSDNDQDVLSDDADADNMLVARLDPNHVWHSVVLDDPISLTTLADLYQIRAQALNSGQLGLDFFAYPSAVDRLHVWDSTLGRIRRVGLARPDAPTGANEGGGGYATVRYFRVRYIEEKLVGGLTTGPVLRRSEPSDALTFTPDGAHAGVTVTRPALINEGETHWEVEASLDNATFYLIATVPLLTTTYNDEVAAATGYSDGILSEDIGEYLPPPAVRYLAVDSDRLLMGGHFTDQTRASSIYWTPVGNDPGVGNAERLPLALDNSVDLDNGDGGEVTGITNSINGIWYVFKWSRIYGLTRTQNAIRAYQVITISTTQGAIHGSVFEGTDATGLPCIYFLDPMLGPCRVGAAGIEILHGLRATWGRVNLHATLPALGIFYPYKRQAHWWIAVDGSDTPSLKLVLQVNETRVSAEGTRRGWSLATGRIAQALCVGSWVEVVTVDAIDSLSSRPVIGLTFPDLVQTCDVASTDAGQSYQAKILTRPYYVNDLLNDWGAMAGALLTSVSPTSIVLTLIRDFGVDSHAITVDLHALGAETVRLAKLDNCTMSDARGIQFQITDP